MVSGDNWWWQGLRKLSRETQYYSLLFPSRSRVQSNPAVAGVEVKREVGKNREEVK